jgi:hypothetical protein
MSSKESTSGDEYKHDMHSDSDPTSPQPSYTNMLKNTQNIISPQRNSPSSKTESVQMSSYYHREESHVSSQVTYRTPYKGHLPYEPHLSHNALVPSHNAPVHVSHNSTVPVSHFHQTTHSSPVVFQNSLDKISNNASQQFTHNPLPFPVPSTGSPADDRYSMTLWHGNMASFFVYSVVTSVISINSINIQMPVK